MRLIIQSRLTPIRRATPELASAMAVAVRLTALRRGFLVAGDIYLDSRGFAHPQT